MIALYFIQRYLNKLSDFNFREKWTNHFIKYAKRYFLGATIYYIVGTSLISRILLIGNDSVFFTLITFFLVTIFYGVFFIRDLVRFLAKNNSRLLNLSMGQQTETFNKDNVVG